MATTPEQFFSKNMKWFALVLLLLFLFKTTQSCNRKMKLNMGAKQYIEQIDSLKNLYSNYKEVTQDSIKKLNFELKLQGEKAQEADKRAAAVQSVAEKIRANTTTTVNVRGAEIDTTKNK
jgi:hypothetical protein